MEYHLKYMMSDINAQFTIHNAQLFMNSEGTKHSGFEKVYIDERS